MNLGNLLFSFKGRIRRRDYWLASLTMIVIALGLEFAAFHFLGSGGNFLVQMQLFRSGHLDGFFYAYIVILIVLAWPQLAVNIKRWQDRNRPGYLAVLMMIASYVSLAVGMAKLQLHDPRITLASNVFNIAYGLFAIWALVECGFLEGTRGANAYGPSPKGFNQDVSAVF